MINPVEIRLLAGPDLFADDELLDLLWDCSIDLKL
jgi:hypothetical protein